MLTVEFSDIFGPDFFHGPYLLTHLLEAGLIDRAVVLHLLSVPPPANAEEKTPT